MNKKTNKAKVILDAAQTVLAREGFSGITIASVAEEAGVSRGLLHYYFRDKEEMLAKMLRRSSEESWETIGSIMAESDSPEEFATKISRAIQEYYEEHPGGLAPIAEGMAASRIHPRVQAELTAQHQKAQERFSLEFERWAATGRFNLPASFPGLATIFVALFDGLGLELQAVSGLAEKEETWDAFEAAVVRLLT